MRSMTDALEPRLLVAQYHRETIQNIIRLRTVYKNTRQQEKVNQ